MTEKVVSATLPTSATIQIKEPNCKINIDCYGSISVEAPTVADAKELMDYAVGVKQKKALQEAIR